MNAWADTQKLNNINIKTVGSLLGINLPAKGMTHCPFPDHNDSTPSFEVRNQGRRWVCYGCDRRGGAIDLVMEYYGKTFIEAKRWLAEQSGYAGHATMHLSSRLKRAPVSPTTSAREDFVKHVEEQSDHEVYHFLLSNSPLRNTGANYLAKRGLSKIVLDRFRVGQMPNTSTIRDMVSKFGFERIKKGGLLTRKSNSIHFSPVFLPNSILFPFFEEGKITYFQGRKICDHDKMRWTNLNQRRQRVYNVDILKNKKIARIAICEGVIDVLSATQLKCEAIGLIGVSASLSETQISKLMGRQIDLLLDWDVAGERRSAKMRRELSLFGVIATRRTVPRGTVNDVNDYLQLGKTRI